MGILAPKIESAEALKTIARYLENPWYKKSEWWGIIIANIIAVIALFK